jgi:hypothetical protein
MMYNLQKAAAAAAGAVLPPEEGIVHPALLL